MEIYRLPLNNCWMMQACRMNLLSGKMYRVAVNALLEGK